MNDSLVNFLSTHSSFIVYQQEIVWLAPLIDLSTPSGSSPQKDILRYPEIDIQTSGYLKDIFCGYQRIWFWIWKDIFLGYQRISITNPFISSLNPWIYPADILHIHRYPWRYLLISIEISYDLWISIYISCLISLMSTMISNKLSTDIQWLILSISSRYP